MSGSLCHNPVNGRIYSANWFGGTVSVIDCATDTVIAAVQIGESPLDVCYAGSNNCVYCAYGDAAGADTVAVISGDSNTLVARVPVGAGVFALRYVTHENAVYCANMADSTVSVIDCGTNQVTATIITSPGASALCLDSLHNKLYCGDFAADSVSVIDCGTNQLVQTLPAGKGPAAFAFNHTWSRVYVANDQDSTVTVYRDTSAPGVADTRSVSGTVSGGPSIVRGVLTLPASGATTHALLDRTGRVVMSLCPGANDVSHLAPGVYYLSEHPTSRGGRPALTPFRKLIVTR
jgi:YVTN family beta-propeller protein